MSAKSDGVGFSHQGVGRRASAGQSLPKPYPLTVVYSAYSDTAADTVYQTFFAFGPESFTSADYYTTAIVASVAPTQLSVGAEGSDSLAIVVPTGRWMRHGLQAYDTGSGRNHRFYYDLPKLDFVDRSASAGYFAATSGTSYIRMGDVWWANAETIDGRLAGLKIWQAILPPQAMALEAQSPFPVLERYRSALWCCIPLRTGTDTFDISGNGRHFFPGSGGSAPITRADPPWRLGRRTNFKLGVTADLPPSFSAQPTDQAGVVGGTATFTTTVTGPGSITYQWQKSADGTTFSNVSGGTGGTSDDYTTPTIVRSDGGAWFRLQATNAFGTTNSNRVMLTVTDIPASYAAAVGLVVGSGA